MNRPEPRTSAAGSPQHAGRPSRVSFSPERNRLLGIVLPALSAQAARCLEPAYVEKGTSLYEPGALITHVLFPVGGMVSLGYAAASGETVELALVGREGVVGIEAFLGAERSSHRATAQTMCAAYRLPVSVARSLFAEHGELQRATLKYALSVMLQVSHTSFCNLHHSPEQRLCRSLLQSVDRNASDTLPMTQDALASLVGARRQGVSEAVKRLRDRGAIAYGRGTITVLDRGRLLRSACDCYAAVQAQLEALRVDNLR